MSILIPRIVVLDSSTLGVVSRDFWSPDPFCRAKARAFISDLQDRGVVVALTLIHMYELLRHENESVARERLQFLGRLPLIAWLRPYDRNWFTGSGIDLFVRELHTFWNAGIRTWREIAQNVRSELWETGTGEEMFVKNDLIWEFVRVASIQQHARDKYIASAVRTHVGDVAHLTIAKSRSMTKRPCEEWKSYMPLFAREMFDHLQKHGDKRLENPAQIASEFSRETFDRMQTIGEMGGDTIDALISHFKVPRSLVGPGTTIDELGEMAVYAEQLKLFTRRLTPSCMLTMLDVPMRSLPAYTLHRQIAAKQNQAERISASDLGDGHLASLVIYADHVQVDKRTHHHLDGLRRTNPLLGELMCPFFKASDYSKIPGLLG